MCSSLTSITFPASLTWIGNSAFYKCTSLTSITIPNSVTNIGHRAFMECTSLTDIVVASENIHYSSIDGVLFNKNKTTLFIFPAGKSETSYVIPNTVTSIGDYAFEGCYKLTSITSLAKTAPALGNSVFLNVALSEINVPADSTGYGSIYGGLSVVTLLAPVVNLESFYESNSGTNLTIDATPTSGSPVSYTYQWSFKAVGSSSYFAIPGNFGGTASSYQITGTTDNNGTWKVAVTNDTGITTHEFEYRVFTDADSDGLSDYRESNITNTNPSLADTDSDGLNDFVEVNTTLTDPNDNDSDDDTLLDGAEVNTYGSDPNNTDSDNDGLLDGAEVNTYSTSPINADSDNDTLTDSQEVLTYFTNPNLADSDSDGLSDAAELNTYFSLPNTSDTDGDGLTDGDEVNIHSSSPIDSDSDDDTILDGIEVRHATFGFDPAVDSSTRLAALIALVEEFPGVLTDAQRQGLSLGGVSLTPRAGGGLSFDFIIEESEDLSTWTTVNTVSHTLDTTGTKKFIRVRKTPQ